jgi:hypothetical protein
LYYESKHSPSYYTFELYFEYSETTDLILAAVY